MRFKVLILTNRSKIVNYFALRITSLFLFWSSVNLVCNGNPDPQGNANQKGGKAQNIVLNYGYFRFLAD